MGKYGAGGLAFEVDALVQQFIVPLLTEAAD
jgi:hypothetical protein